MKKSTIILSLMLVATSAISLVVAQSQQPSQTPDNLPNARFNSIELTGGQGIVHTNTVTNNSLSTGGFFVGVSTGTFANTNPTNQAIADPQGYAKANALCNDTFSGSHVCRSDEITNTAILFPGLLADVTDVPSAWINNGVPAYDMTFSNDCRAWSYTNPAARGSVWHFVRNEGLMGSCSEIARRFACCR